MKNFLPLLSAALFTTAATTHAVTITLDAEELRNELGALMPTSGLVVLTAATTGTFHGPTATSFVSGDEVLLWKWNLTAFNEAGLISDTTPDLPLGGGWSVGDPLRIYWYPSLLIDTAAPGAGTHFGTYTDPVGLESGDAWITPGGAALISLKFATSDADFLFFGGSNAPSAGFASQVVPGAAPVPEPGTVFFGIALLGAAGLRRRRTR